MKKVFTYTLFIVLYSFVSSQIGFCQKGNNIEISNLMITKSNQQGFINLGFSKQAVKAAFGKPPIVKKSYFTKFDFRGEMFDYRGAKFYFSNNTLIAFELLNNQFALKIKGRNDFAEIGNFLTGFGNGLPNSIVLQNNGVPQDEVLGLIFDAAHKISYLVCGPD